MANTVRRWYWKMHDRAVNQLFFWRVGKSAPVSVEFDCPSSTAMILDFRNLVRLLCKNGTSNSPSNSVCCSTPMSN